MYSKSKSLKEKYFESLCVTRTQVSTLIHSNKGIGIKEVAATIGILVVVGLIFSYVKGNLGSWLDWFFNTKLKDFINTTFQ